VKILTIHLSDIHIHIDDLDFHKYAKKLASSIFTKFRNSDLCVIAITGDIAFSGKAEEYKIAEQFLINLKKLLQGEKEIDVIFAISPGNHDCDIPKKDTVRELLIKSLNEDSNLAFDEEIITQVTSVQNQFFEFKNRIKSDLEEIVDSLLSIVSIEVKDFKINFLLFNVSWMSSINEKQGTLVFPIDRYKEYLERDAFTVSLLHHPLNWYCQDSYHPFKHCLQVNSDLVLSGHEHVARSYAVKSERSSSAMYFEAPSFDAKSNNKSFVTIELDFENSTIEKTVFKETGVDFDSIGDRESYSFIEKNNTSLLSEEFYSYISSVGANLWHPNKRQLTIDDVYIPLQLSSNSKEDSVSSSEIDVFEKCILISGEEASGKTKLLHNIFIYFLSSDISPVFIDSKFLKRTTVVEFKKTLNAQLLRQYKESDFFDRLPKSKRAILIDNIEGFGIDKKGFPEITKYIKENFGSVVVSCSENLNMTSVASVLYHLYEFDERFSIKDISANGRASLINNWQSCGGEIKVLDSKYNHKVEQTINTVLGRNLIPSRPLFLLTLLQSATPSGTSELTDSGLSYYYQYLITKGLEESGVNRSSFDELFNYLSNLAWHYKANDSDAMEYDELKGFNEIFSEKFTVVNLEKQLDLFVRAKLLFFDGVEYRFSYPYIKYFFVGKYLADNIERSDISTEINRYCSNLYTSEDSTTILFLTHHRNSEWVIREISHKLSKCYDSYESIKYEDDNSAYLASMVGSVSNIIIEELDIKRNNEVRRSVEDNHGKNSEPTDDYFVNGDGASSEEIQTLFTVIRSAEVLGQITKNYYGSIERASKRDNMKCIIDTFLRMLNYVFDDLSKNELDIRNQLGANIRNVDKNITQSELEILSGKLVAKLVSALSSGIIFKIAHTIYSDKLIDDIKYLSNESGENSYLLVEAASYLMSPEQPSVSKIKAINRKLGDNVVAQKVMQDLVLYHISMFDTNLKTKQALGDMLGIRISSRLGLEK
jgi:predicted MPP superfamily phosphohydrolase